jgi:hypothetical protein
VKEIDIKCSPARKKIQSTTKKFNQTTRCQKLRKPAHQLLGGLGNVTAQVGYTILHPVPVIM